MPAFVNRSVGSSAGTSGELGTMRWPLPSKNSRKDARMSFAFTFLILVGRLRTASEPRLQRSKDAIRFESLTHEIPVQPPELTIVHGARPAAQPTGDRRLEKRI